VDLGDHRLAVIVLAAVVLFTGVLFGVAARETWRGAPAGDPALRAD
jgi:hypothetical protein